MSDTYPIDLCGHCHHPGGAHRIDEWEPRVTHCRYCDCPGWDECDVYRGRWSDQQTRDAEAACQLP